MKFFKVFFSASPMKNRRVKSAAKVVLLLAAVLCVVVLLTFESTVVHTAPRRETTDRRPRAIATLLTNDAYSEGVAALYASLFDNDDHDWFRDDDDLDFVVLYTANVDPKFIERLQSYVGCVPKLVSNIDNPYDPNTRFDGSFSKLHIWNLTEYRQVAYLDADCFVTSDPNLLFECNNVCVRPNTPPSPNTFRFNAGVMVVRPSAKLFKQLTFLLRHSVLPSADNADQGFLNSYFFYYCSGVIDGREDEATVLERIRAWHLAHPKGAMLDPGQMSDVRDQGLVACKSIPWTYNFDVGAHGKWVNNWPWSLFRRHEPVIYQFTGAFKPWHCKETPSAGICSSKTHTMYRRFMYGDSDE
jgi:hypothetical protein